MRKMGLKINRYRRYYNARYNNIKILSNNLYGNSLEK